MKTLLATAAFAAWMIVPADGAPEDHAETAGRKTAWEALEKAQKARYARTGLLMDSTVEDFCFSATLRDGTQATDAVAVARDVRLCQGGLDPVRHRDLIERLRRFEQGTPAPMPVAPDATDPAQIPQ